MVVPFRINKPVLAGATKVTGTGPAGASCCTRNRFPGRAARGGNGRPPVVDGRKLGACGGSVSIMADPAIPLDDRILSPLMMMLEIAVVAAVGARPAARRRRL